MTKTTKRRRRRKQDANNDNETPEWQHQQDADGENVVIVDKR